MFTEQTKENIVIDDSLLARQCAKGDKPAMELLISKYQDRVYNVVMKICTNQHDAMELTQDTFVKVIENIGNFRANSRLYTWIFRIAVNLTLNFCKRKVKIGFESLERTSAGESDSARQRLVDYLADDSAEDPARLAQDRELQEIAMQSLNSLDGDHKSIVVLRDIEGLSYAEIAEVLEIEIGTVKSRLSRARESLRKFLTAVIE